MYLLGYTLDNFSLMALTVATGFVVDDAIVVMENTTRHIEAGMSRMSAALLGAREVGFTVVSMSLSLVAVFIPFMFAGGIVGRNIPRVHRHLVHIHPDLARDFPDHHTDDVLETARSGQESPPVALWRSLRRGFGRLRRGYERTLDWALHHPRTMMLVLCATVGVNIYLYVVIPKGFFPQQDTGQLQGGIRGDASSSFQLMKRKLQEVEKNHPGGSGGEHRHGFRRAAAGFGPGGGASANVTIALKPLKERRISADQIIARLRPKLNRVRPAWRWFLQAVQDIGGGGGRSAIRSTNGRCSAMT